jgi:hypothetical protein
MYNNNNGLISCVSPRPLCSRLDPEPHFPLFMSPLAYNSLPTISEPSATFRPTTLHHRKNASYHTESFTTITARGGRQNDIVDRGHRLRRRRSRHHRRMRGHMVTSMLRSTTRMRVSMDAQSTNQVRREVAEEDGGRRISCPAQSRGCANCDRGWTQGAAT